MTLLGMAWLRGPCTTYALMKELASSSSTFYKSRAGTAYLVVKRLLGFGLLETLPSNKVQITPEGTQHLIGWVSPPIALSEIAHSADLVRLRFFFLGALELEARLAFIDHCVEGLRQFKIRTEELLTENQQIGDYFGALATLSIILETQARIEWLTIVRRLVEKPLQTDSDWAAAILAAVQSSRSNS